VEWYQCEDGVFQIRALKNVSQIYNKPTNVRGPGYLSRCSDSLRAGRSGDRIPLGARFSVPVQTGPGANPTSYTAGNGSFPGVKRWGRGVDHPPHPVLKLKQE